MDAKTAAVLSSIKTPLQVELMLSEITGVTNGESQAGRPQTVVDVAPVVDDYPQRDLALQMYIQRPLDDATPGELGKLKSKGGGFLRAVDTNFPKAPKRVAKGVYQTQDGATLQGPAVDQAFTADRIAVFEGLERLAGDEDYCESLVGQRVFMKPQKLKIDVEADRPPRQFVSFITAELREGDTILEGDPTDPIALEQLMALALAKAEEL